jgi:hypothetical protein
MSFAPPLSLAGHDDGPCGANPRRRLRRPRAAATRFLKRWQEPNTQASLETQDAMSPARLESRACAVVRDVAEGRRGSRAELPESISRPGMQRSNGLDRFGQDGGHSRKLPSASETEGELARSLRAAQTATTYVNLAKLGGNPDGL